MSDTETKPAVETTEEAKSSPTPIFGSASTFGAGSGFGGFTGLSTTAAAPAATADGEDDDGNEPATEEECAAEFKPVVQLDEVEVSTGEEDEDSLFDVKSKLYRFDNDSGEWKERGVGQSKLLQHKESKRIRFLFRQDKTLKVRSNHVVMPGTNVQEHSGSEKAMVWSCVDFADEVQKPELFCIRFGSAERAQEFKKAYEEACEKNKELFGAGAAEGGDGEEVKEEVSAADELAAQVEAVKVEDKEEEKAE